MVPTLALTSLVVHRTPWSSSCPGSQSGSPWRHGRCGRRTRLAAEERVDANLHQAPARLQDPGGIGQHNRVGGHVGVSHHGDDWCRVAKPTVSQTAFPVCCRNLLADAFRGSVYGTVALDKEYRPAETVYCPPPHHFSQAG